MGVRRYTVADEPAVRRIFRQTLSLGRPLSFDLPGLVRYERLCLGWFLGPGAGDVGVYDDGGHVRGYVLVCTDLTSYYRWAARAAARWSLGSGARLAVGRLRGDAGRFHRLRLLDGWLALRHPPVAPMPALVHLNLDRSARGGLAALGLVRHADERCRLAGRPGWFGEVNSPGGDRATALEAIGLRPVHRQPNRTISWLLGEPVDRLTVVRSLDRAFGRPAGKVGPHPPARPDPAVSSR